MLTATLHAYWKCQSTSIASQGHKSKTNAGILFSGNKGLWLTHIYNIVTVDNYLTNYSDICFKVEPDQCIAMATIQYHPVLPIIDILADIVTHL